MLIYNRIIFSIVKCMDGFFFDKFGNLYTVNWEHLFTPECSATIATFMRICCNCRISKCNVIWSQIDSRLLIYDSFFLFLHFTLTHTIFFRHFFRFFLFLFLFSLQCYFSPYISVRHVSMFIEFLNLQKIYPFDVKCSPKNYNKYIYFILGCVWKIQRDQTRTKITTKVSTKFSTIQLFMNYECFGNSNFS